MRILRWALVPVLVMPLAWLLFQGLGHDPRALPSPLIGRPAPDFELIGIDGRTVASTDLRGHVVIVNFWASWCVECIAEHRVLLEAHQQYGPDLLIIGVLYQDTVDSALSFLGERGNGGWPNLVDPNGGLAIDFGVTGVPESYLIDAAGIVRYKQYGALTRAVLDVQLPALLRDPSSPPG